jgi:hypothetical protein
LRCKKGRGNFSPCLFFLQELLPHPIFSLSDPNCSHPIALRLDFFLSQVIQCIPEEAQVRIKEFEWDDGNVLHIELGHGIEPEEAEEVFAVKPLFRKTKRNHYVAMGPTLEGRYLSVVFELKRSGVGRVITGWDMAQSEKRCWRKQGGK